MQNSLVLSELELRLFEQVTHSVAKVQSDIRDPLPCANAAYTTVEVLHKGEFGRSILGQTSVPNMMSAGNEQRRCFLKYINLKKQFSRIATESQMSELDVTTGRVTRLLRRTVMELLVTGSCRHENLMHYHAAYLSDGFLVICMPRFHVLRDLVTEFRDLNKNEPMPMTIIAPIIRQLAKALAFLQEMGIMHRDVQPSNILLTRNGTVKLSHFAQSKVIGSEQLRVTECRTPVGREEFMCAEKLSNLSANGLSECRPYGFDADVWSLGVLVLNMVSYFPDERHHRLHRNFGLLMEQEQATFVWLTADMVQLRARMLQSGGTELKNFLSNVLLNPYPRLRPTARQLLQDSRLLAWCKENIDLDKAHLKKRLIEHVDFANRLKIEKDGINYDALECKDIPAEFYWGDDWKRHDSETFIVFLTRRRQTLVHCDIHFFKPDQLISPLFCLVENGHIQLGDVIPLHKLVLDISCDLIRCAIKPVARDGSEYLEKDYAPCQGTSPLPPDVITVRVAFGPKEEQQDSFATDQSDSF